MIDGAEKTSNFIMIPGEINWIPTAVAFVLFLVVGLYTLVRTEQIIEWVYAQNAFRVYRTKLFFWLVRFSGALLLLGPLFIVIMVIGYFLELP